MSIGGTAASLEKYLQALCRIFTYIGLGAIVVIMVVQVADVVSRAAFNYPIVGTMEIITDLMVPLAYLGMAWCAVRKGHARVDIVITRLPQRTRAVLEVLTYLFSLGIMSLICWQGFLETMEVRRGLLSSQMLNIPDYPFHLALSVGCFVLCLVLFGDVLKSIHKAVSK